MQAAGPVERRLAAILAADVAGYSRHVARDDRAALERLTEIRRIAGEEIAAQRGALVDTAGDSCLAHFASVTDAVTCAVALQRRVASFNELHATESRMELRIGIHLGDLLMRGSEVFGDGVNVAARLQAEAEPGGICVSAASREHLASTLNLAFEELGELSLKNIDRPVRAYRLVGEASRRVEAALALPLPDKPSIAVLPFTNMSGDPEQEYFADGITEDIITALSRIRWFFVIARNSSFTYKGRAVDVRQVGRELGVRYVLEGSVRRAGNRLRITGQLVEAESGQHVWAEKYDGAFEDVFELQDRVTVAVASAIEPSLSAAELKRSRDKPDRDLGAYHLVLRATAEINTYSDQGFASAETLVQRALAIDPNYSDAWALLASIAFFRMVGGMLDRDAARATGLEAAHRAVRADPHNPTALSTAAAALTVLGGSLDQAVEFADQALKQAPTSAPVNLFCGLTYNFDGQFDRALELVTTARRLNPADPRGFVAHNQITISHFFSQRFEEAIRSARRGLAEYPRFTPMRRFLICGLAHLGRLDEARAEVADLLEVQPNSTVALASRANWRFPWMHQMVLDGLRLAGLPE